MSLTTKEVPLEIQLQIFKHLPLHTLKEYQFVCKSWYHAARHPLLETVNITRLNAVQFAEYMDHNPLYKKYVKKVYVRYGRQQPKAGEPSIEEVCKTIQVTCPEVQAVYCSETVGSDYIDLLYNLRNTIKEIEINQNYLYKGHGRGNVVDFLAQFPRLKKVQFFKYCGVKYIEHWLRLFEKSPFIEDFSCSEIVPVERDLQTQPDSALVNTLSKVKNFQVSTAEGYMGSAALNKFIKQYLTGLQYLCVKGSVDPHEFDEVEQSLMVDLRNIACTVKEFTIDIKSLSTSTVYHYLPSVPNTVYYQIPETRVKKVHRVLAVETTVGDFEQDSPFCLTASCSEHKLGELTRSIKLKYALKSSTRETLEDTLSLCSEIRDIDTLDFLIQTDGRSTFGIFRELLDSLDYIKKVILETPDGIFGRNYTNKYESVTYLQLRTRIWREDIEKKLANVVKMFPRVKKLNLSGYCGVLENFNQFYVLLDELDLDSLEIDVHTWASSWNLNKHADILLSVDVKEKNVKYFYKVLYDDLWVNEIQEHDYAQLKEPKVNVKVKNLTNLILYRKQKSSTEDLATTLSFK